MNNKQQFLLSLTQSIGFCSALVYLAPEDFSDALEAHLSQLQRLRESFDGVNLNDQN